MDNDNIGSIVAAVALSCIGVFGVLAAPILANTLGASLGLSAGDIGNIVGAEIGGGALASIAAAFWIQRVNWRIAAFVGITAVVTLNLLSGLQSDAGALAALRFAAGFIGQGTAFAVAIGVINASSNPDRIFGFSVAAQVATGVVTLLVLPGLGEQWGVRGILWPLAGLALLVLPTLGWVPARSPKTSHAAGAAQQAATGSSAPALTALLVLLIWCIGLGGMWAFLISVGVAGGLESATAGRAIAISTFIGISGALVASALAGRGGRLLPVSVALLVQMGAIMLLQGDMSFLRFAATAAVFQTFWNFTGPYLMGMVAESDKTGRISVLIPAAQTGGFAIGPWLASRMMTDDSMLAANYVGVGGCLIALLIFLPVVLRLQRSARALA